MTNTDDYFVSFGSNVDTWANDIKTHVDGAKRTIDGFLSTVKQLDEIAARNPTIKIALARQAVEDAKRNPVAGGGGTGAGGKSFLLEQQALSTAIYEQADALKAYTADAHTMIQTMQGVVNSMKTLPGQLKGTIRSINQSLTQLTKQREGKGRYVDPTTGVIQKDGTRGAVQIGSVEHQVRQSLNKALSEGALRGFQREPTGVSTVGQQALERAGFDRVVLAIRAQTRVLQGGLPMHIEGGPTNAIHAGGGVVPTTPGGNSAAEVMAPVLTARQKLVAEITQIAATGKNLSLTESREYVDRMDKELASFTGKVADMDAEAAGIFNLLKEARRSLQASIRAEEKAGGATQGELSAAARAKAEADRKARPTITSTELQQRQIKQSLVDSVGAEDFASRAKAKYTGPAGFGYQKEDLKAMAGVFRELGIAVDYTTKSTKKDIAELLQAAHAEYTARHPEGAEALRTSGFNVERVTQISDRLDNVLGNLTDRIAERTHALEVLKTDAATGGKRQQPAQRVESLPGMIGVPPAMVKGRRQVGAAIGDHGDSVYTPQQVLDAEAALRPNAQREMARVQKLAADPTFDPHMSLRSVIKPGASDAERVKAQAAADALRDTQLATEELDRMGQEFLGLIRALQDTEAIIERLKKVGVQNLGPNDFKSDGTKNGDQIAEINRRDRDQLQQAVAERDNIVKGLQRTGAGGRAELFASPGYQEGLVQREGSLTGTGGSGRDQAAQRHYLEQERAGTGVAAQAVALEAKVTEAKAEVTAAEKAIADSTAQIQKANAKAAKGKNINIEEYDRQVDKLGRANEGLIQWTDTLGRLTEELKALDRVTEITDEGLAKVASGVEGMGSRQRLAASREASAAAGRPTLSDRRLLLSAQGQALANVGTRTGSRTIIGQGISSDLGFNDKTSQYYSKSQRLSQAEQQKLNSATGHLATAQRDYFEMVNSGLATQEELDAAFKALENAANRFANRLQKSFGLAPSFESLAGVTPRGGDHPLDHLGYDASLGYGHTFSDKTIKDEARRQAARDNAEALRTSKPQPTATDKLARADNSLVLATERLEKLRNERSDAEARAAEYEAQISKKMADSGIRTITDQEHAFGAATKAEQEYERALVERNKLMAQRNLHQDPALALRDPNGRADLENTAHLPGTLRDTQGYDASLGYNPSINSALAAAEKRVVEAYEARAAAVEKLNPPSEEQQTADRLMKESLEAEAKVKAAYVRWAEEVDRLAAAGGPTTSPILGHREKDIYTAQDKADAARTAAQGAQERALGIGASTSERLTSLKAERAAALKQVVSAREEGDLKENSGYHAAVEAVNRLDSQIQLLTHQIGDDLVKKFQNTLTEVRSLDRAVDEANAALAKAEKEQAKAAKRVAKETAAGGAGGGKKPPTRTTTTGGDGGFGEEANSILRLILAETEKINGILSKGIKVTGTGRASTSAGGVTEPVTRTKSAGASTSTTDDAKEQAKLEQAIENQRIKEERRQRNSSRAARAASRETIAATRAEQKAQEADAAAIRARVRAEQNLAEVVAKSSQETKTEIAELERLTKAAAQAATEEERLAAQAAIVGQQQKVASSLGSDLKRQGVGAEGQRTAIRTALNTAGPRIGTEELDQVLRGSRGATGAFRAAGVQWGGGLAQGTQSGFQKVFGGGTGFFDRILHTTGTFLVRNFAAGFVFGLTNQLQTAVAEAIKTQQTFVRLSSTLAATGKDIGNLRVDLQGLSSQYGVSLNDLYDTAAKLAGVFRTPLELQQGTKTVAELQMISEGALSAEEGVGALTSIWSAWQNELKDQGGAEHIADVATALQNLTGVNIQETIKGMARLSGQASQMAISAEETATFVAQISRETDVGGATAGEQLSRILAQAQGTAGQTALKSALGSDVFSRNTSKTGVINYGNILKQLIGDWDNLSKAQQQNLTHVLAGTRQAATFNALMDNGSRTLQNLTTAQNSAGAAADRMRSLMHTLTGEIARLGANFKSLIKNLIDTGLFTTLGIFLELTNQVLGGINKLLASMNQVASENPLVNAFEKMIATGAGFLAILTLIKKGLTGLRAAIGGNSLLSLVRGGGAAAGGGRVAGAVGQSLAAGAERDLASALKLQSAAALTAAGAEARLTAATGPAAKAMAGLSGAEERVAAASAGVVAAQERVVAASDALVLSGRRQVAASEGATAAQTELAAALGVLAAAEGKAAALAVVYDQEAAAVEAYVAAVTEAEAVLARGNATGAELAAVEAGLVTAEEELLAVIRLRMGAEEAAAGAAGASAAGGIKGGIAKLGSSIVGAAKSWTGVAVAAAGAYFLAKSLGDQVGRVEKAVKESGGGAPEVGGTSGEYKAASRSYNAALAKSNADESKGLFGLGFGPSLTKAITRGIPLPGGGYTGLESDKYVSADLHQANLAEISASLRDASRVTSRLANQQARQVGDVKSPTFTAFDTDYLTTRLTALTNKGQTAGKELHELSLQLTEFAKGGKAASHAILGQAGSYQARGQTTGNLNNVALLNTPGLQDILDKLGVSGSGLGGRLEQALGTNTNPNAADLAGGLRGPTTAGATKPLDSKAAIQRMKDEILHEVEPAATGSSYEERLKSLGPQQAAAYKKTYQLLNKFFKADLHSYETLIGEATLSRKDANSLLDMIDQKAQDAIANLPDSSLHTKTIVMRRALAAARSTFEKTPVTGNTLLKLQQREDAFAEAKYAEFDAVRQAAQAATKDSKKMYAAGLREIRKGVALAVKTGDATLLATVIAEGGKVALALAKKEVAILKAAWAAYDQMVIDVTNATNAVAAEYSSGLKKPGTTRKALKQLEQSIKYTPAPDSKDSSILGPALADAASAKQDASQVRQDRAALVQARLGVAEAYAQARGDAVAAARIEVKIAAAGVAAARADLAAAKTLDERLQAQAAIYSAQAQLIAAHAGVAQAQAELVSSQYDVSIALAEAAGRTVEAAKRRAKQAEAALHAALRQSHGKNTAAVNQARAGAIAAEAAVRDAKLQDELDTIDFNLQMGRITQSSAIHALQHILRTEELTKAQRRQLLLQIKGMKSELADSQWNFGDIKLPTPYQMRRYIDQRRKQFRNEMDSAAAQGSTKGGGGQGTDSMHHSRTYATTTQQTTNITIDGADIGMVKKVIKEVVGGNINVRTTGPRRGNR